MVPYRIKAACNFYGNGGQRWMVLALRPTAYGTNFICSLLSPPWYLDNTEGQMYVDEKATCVW